MLTDLATRGNSAERPTMVFCLDAGDIGDDEAELVAESVFDLAKPGKPELDGRIGPHDPLTVGDVQVNRTVERSAPLAHARVVEMDIRLITVCQEMA